MKVLTIKDIYKDVKNEVRSHYGFHAYTSEVADDMKWHESFSYKIEKLDDSFIEIQVLNRDDFLALLEGIIERKKANMKETPTDPIKNQIDEPNKVTTLSDVVNAVKSTVISDSLVLSFPYPFNNEDRDTLSMLENTGIIGWHSVEILNKYAFLIEVGEIARGKLEIHNGEQSDPITPTHYNGTQTLDRMVAVFGVDAVISFCEINAFECRMMAGKKDDNTIEQDIKKALWYEGKANELKRKDNE